jgi:hypothetical protein
LHFYSTDEIDVTYTLHLPSRGIALKCNQPHS